MNKVNHIQAIFALSLMLLFSQCYYDEVLPEPVEPLPDREISFQGDLIPLFNASCNTSGCHNTGGVAPDLSPANAYNSLLAGNYINTTIPESSELYMWMTGRRDTPMPVEGPNAANNALVLQWIIQGAKNN